MNPQIISDVIDLILAGGSNALSLFLKLEPSLGLDITSKQRIANGIASSDFVDADVLSKVSTWMVTNGMKSRTTVSFVK